MAALSHGAVSILYDTYIVFLQGTVETINILSSTAASQNYKYVQGISNCLLGWKKVIDKFQSWSLSSHYANIMKQYTEIIVNFNYDKY